MLLQFRDNNCSTWTLPDYQYSLNTNQPINLVNFSHNNIID